jgi:putative colanic acid biosynthesis UDP-glucose lipid carrier transferase
LIAANPPRFDPFHRPLRVAALVRAALDPAVAIGALLASAQWFEGRVDGPYVVLALLVFALTFPGGSDWGNGNARALARDIGADWLLVIGLLLLLGWASQTLASFDPRALVAWAVATPALLFAAHRLAPALLVRVLAAERRQRAAVIVGANELGRALGERIATDPLLGIRLVGYFDDRGARRLQRVRVGAPPVLGALRDLAHYVKSRRVDVIYIALPMSSHPRVRALLDELHDTTASIYFVPDILLFDLIQARVDTIGGMPVLAVCESPYAGINAFAKRASDLVLASAILVLTAPLAAAVALGVKLSSPGPVLFRQRRYGVDGREIVVYKFRTMTCLEDGAVVRQATRDDPRTTRFGAFLRRYSLDELPQFVNVLQGRMSVVGPRPHAVAHNELYRKLIRGYMIRHKVRPGITGLAQVRGLRGETDSIEKMRARVACDLEYLRHWSLLLDLRIVLRTIAVVLKRDNAY